MLLKFHPASMQIYLEKKTKIKSKSKIKTPNTIKWIFAISKSTTLLGFMLLCYSYKLSLREPVFKVWTNINNTIARHHKNSHWNSSLLLLKHDMTLVQVKQCNMNSSHNSSLAICFIFPLSFYLSDRWALPCKQTLFEVVDFSYSSSQGTTTIKSCWHAIQ